MNPHAFPCLILAAVSLLPVAATAASLTTETGSQPTEWTIRHLGKPVFTYSFAPGRYKPYVRVLATPDGRNVLRDAPADHLHHHALMYAIRVNGLNFWEEISGSGIERPIETLLSAPEDLSPGVARATLVQTLHWLPPESAFLPDSTIKALLLERRTLRLTVDTTRQEVALHWRSEFEVGQATNQITLSGSSYFGLGARFQAELDATATHLTPQGILDLSNNRQDVSQHPWAAVSFRPPDGNLTFAILGHPRNPAGLPHFFSMKTPFAYLSATEGLEKQPRIHRRGDRFQIDHLILVTPSILTADALNARQQRWVQESR